MFAHLRKVGQLISHLKGIPFLRVYPDWCLAGRLPELFTETLPDHEARPKTRSATEEGVSIPQGIQGSHGSAPWLLLVQNKQPRLDSREAGNNHSPDLTMKTVLIWREEKSFLEVF